MPDHSAGAVRRIVIPFHDHIKLEFLPDGARIPDAVELTNHFGSVHGSALFAVGEIAAARTLVGLLGEDAADLRAITRSAEIRYLKMAHGAITGEARVRMERAALFDELARLGRARPVIDVQLKDETGLVVGELTVESHVSRAAPIKSPDNN